MPYYLGKRPQRDWVLFASHCTPTKETHGHLYPCAQGPFRTRLAARWFNRYGWGNPHVHTVADTEQLAREAARENLIAEQWLLEEGLTPAELEEMYAFEAYEQGVDLLVEHDRHVQPVLIPAEADLVPA